MGAAVISKVKTMGRQIDAMDIIDGQQRLTTLQILLIALRDFVHEMSYDPKLTTELRRLTLNESRMEQDFERFKVWPTNSDREVFERVATAESRAVVEALFPLTKQGQTKPKARHPLAGAYLYFYDAIRDYVVVSEDTSVQLSGALLETLQDAITKRLKLVVIELEDGDNPQIIFETLNARGEPLRASDLIRNFVFFDADRRGEDIVRLYNTYWIEFDQPFESNRGFWKEEERQGRLTRARLDLLVFYYLTYKTLRELPITSLFQEFSLWWRTLDRSHTVEDRLIDLQTYAHLFQSFFTDGVPSRLSVFIERLRILDTGTVYPLLLYLAGERTDIPTDEFDGIIADIESYLVRRNVCGYPSQNYNQFFRSMLQDLSRRDNTGGLLPITRQRVQQLLLASSKVTSVWPTDEEFRVAWLTRAVYQINRKRAEMVLSAIDLHLMTHKQERLHIDGGISIEHIWPQNADPSVWGILEPDQELLIHTFGNLTLVTQSFNSILGNRPFAEKRKAIAQESTLRMNVYFQKPIQAWTPDSIMQRGEDLFKIACTIWSRA
jgi:hypothetical protein